MFSTAGPEYILIRSSTCGFNSPSLFDASVLLRSFNSYTHLHTMDDPLPPNPYKTLNVPKDASLATIRSAYRKLVLTCHPDKVHDESLKQQKSVQFQQVQQAYEILSNDTNRQRYDERSKLAELRAELATERGSPRMPPDTGRRNGYSPATEVREGRVYEERVPRRPYTDEHFSSKYQEPRPSKKYEDDYFSPPPRRSSNRVPDEKRRTRDVEEERELEWERNRLAERHRKEREKAAEKANYSERMRRRDKDRRRESDTKSRSRYASYVNTDSESDSEPALEQYRSLKREATQKRRHEEMPRRSSKRETGDVDEYESREYQRVSAAEEHITKSSRAPLERRQTSYDRVQPSSSTRATQPHPPPPPPAPPADAGRRSSERKHRPRDSTPPRLLPKDHRVIGIVDPPPSRRPSMPGSASDPRGLKNLVPSPRREPTRASTIQAVSEPKPPSIRRSETMPVNGSNYRRGDVAPSMTSKLKHADNHDSGYSSPGTPEYPADAAPLAKSTRYVLRSDDDDGGHHIVKGPEDMRRERETSPKNRRGIERPSLTPRASPSIKTPPTRSTSYAFTPETLKRPSASRTESARATPLPNRYSGRGGALYGEVIPEHNEPYKVVNQSPKIRPDNISYTQTPYSSRDRRSSEDADRDFYSGSHLETRRPGLSRYESSAYESSRVH